MLLKSLISAISFWLVENDNRWVKTLTKYNYAWGIGGLAIKALRIIKSFNGSVSTRNRSFSLFSLFPKNKLILSGVTKTNNFLINIKFI